MSQDGKKETVEPEAPSSPESVEEGIAATRTLIGHAEEVIIRARELLQKMEDFLQRHRAPK